MQPQQRPMTQVGMGQVGGAPVQRTMQPMTNTGLRHLLTQVWISKYNWRPLSLSDLTSYLISLGLTHLGSEASNYLNRLAP